VPGKVHLSADADPDAMQRWGDAMAREGLVSPMMMVRAFLFLRDSNALKNPLAKAERLHLCLDQMEIAHDAAIRAGETGMIQLCYEGIAKLMPEYERQMRRYLMAYHRTRADMLARSRGSARRLAIAEKTLDELGSERMLIVRASPRGTIADLLERLLEEWIYRRDEAMGRPDTRHPDFRSPDNEPVP
jgi:hypothetical protein